MPDATASLRPAHPTLLTLTLPHSGSMPVPDPVIGMPVVDESIPNSSVHIFAQLTPEGVLGVATCSECGARKELLYRLPAPPAEGGAETDQVHRAKQHIGQVRKRLGGQWAYKHECCQPHFPDDLLSIRDLEVHAAGKAFADGRPVGLRCVLASDRGPIALHLPPLPGMPCSALDRVHAQIACAIREHRRRQDIDLLGIVVASPAGGLASARPNDDGKAGLSLVMATPAMAVKTCIAPPRTLEASRDPGSWDWRAVHGQCRMVDGVLASPVDR